MTKVRIPVDFDPTTARPRDRESDAVVGSFTGDREFEMEPAPSREVLTLVVVHGDRASEVVTARGGIAVAELTVTVRAGAFEPLRLPR